MPRSAADSSTPDVQKVMPYDPSAPKGSQVGQMFDSIARAYDVMNNVMTFGLHRRWRDSALKGLRIPQGHASVLDVATGTGDVAFRLHSLFPHAAVTGIDISDGMLDVGRRKLAAASEDARRAISFMHADCLALPFPDNSFDAVTVAYGVRNFPDLQKGLEEMRRVLKPGGSLAIIELSCPRNPVLRVLYDIYSKGLIPLVGRLVSHDPRAYTYLPESIAACPQRAAMTALLTKARFVCPDFRSLTFGVVTIYTATR